MSDLNRTSTSYGGDISTVFLGYCQIKLIIYKRAQIFIRQKGSRRNQLTVQEDGNMRRYVYKQIDYGTTISSFDVLRPLLSFGLLNSSSVASPTSQSCY